MLAFRYGMAFLPFNSLFFWLIVFSLLFFFWFRTCPEIEKLYLLIRPKRGKQPRDRLADVFSNPVSTAYKIL